MMPQIILLGAPGSGKGTQAAKLVAKHGYNHISTGDLLRAEILKKTELGNRIACIIERGQLVDDDIVLELLKANCDFEKGCYIFDGYPRSIDQAKSLDAIILAGRSIFTIYLEADLDELVSRITNRRTCSNKSCSEIYNLLNKKPLRDGVCDKCGAELVLRKDDNLATVNNRFDIFRTAINEILHYYKSKGVLTTFDAHANPEFTFELIQKVLCV